MSPEVASIQDTQMMVAALELAKRALAAGEFPVGCVIASGNTVVAEGQRTGTATASGNEVDHAEINALRQLSVCGSDIERSGLTVYATMEPCLMCFAAIVLSGIGRIVYAYEDVMGGGTRCDRSRMSPLYRDASVTVVPGLLRQNSLELFRHFFLDPDNDYWAGSRLCRYTLDQSSSP
jgi:tRNA(adenine34) deaminase